MVAHHDCHGDKELYLSLRLQIISNAYFGTCAAGLQAQSENELHLKTSGAFATEKGPLKHPLEMVHGAEGICIVTPSCQTQPGAEHLEDFMMFWSRDAQMSG